ncbi:MAG: PilN domain-containing protein [Acidimicrobiia bacterium]|nr:PilN domain-containing protein [Acidimicrobiia bacterium]
MRPINLLPPEVSEKSKARRRAFGAILGILGFIAVLALATVWMLGQASDAEAELEAQQQENQRLQAEIASLDGARQLRSDYQTGVSRVQLALVTDVAWGRLLNDLARIISDGAWLSSLSAEASAPTETDFSFGTLSVAGTAFWYEDASSWLRVLDSSYWPAVAAGWVSSTSVGEIEEIPVVNFTSAAALTSAALSTRIVDLIPEVPE